MSLRPGDAFGRYLVECRLGEGGAGEVYRAVDQRLGRKVALKLLRRDEDAEGPAFGQEVERMLREARFAAALRDPSFVAIYDAGELLGVPFLAMELVTGTSLRDVITSEIPLSDRIVILRAIAFSLSVAHRAGLVHRNVKPENVIVLPGNTIKILDFGVAFRTAQPAESTDRPAKDVKKAESGRSVRKSLFPAASAYMAPEELRGDVIDGRADQFAWGLVAYELLTGRHPFRKDRAPDALALAIVRDEPPPISRRIPSKNDEMPIPRDLSRIILRALHKKPDDRYPSMDAIVSALYPFVDTPDNEEEPLAEANAFARWLQHGLFTLVLVIFAATVFIIWKITPEQKAQTKQLLIAFPAPAPTPVTALPLPPAASPEAKNAYREGLQALRDGAWLVAYAAFDRATKLDASLAGAWMRMALIIQDSDATLARGYFRKATMNRGLLSQRDADLLDALEPIIQRTPSDLPEMGRRLALLRARFPGDAELASLFAVYAVGLLSPEDALLAADRCLEVDPQEGDCLQVRARTLLRRLGRVDEGLATLERCIAATPGATDCFSDIGTVHSSLGRCDLVELDARGWIARSPRSPVAHALLASALYARDPRSPAVVSAALGAASRYREHGLHGEEMRRRIEVAIAMGHFDEALQLLETFLQEMADDPAEDAQSWPTYMMVSLLRETGRLAEAGKVAEAFLARRNTMIAGTVGLRWLDYSVFFWRTKFDAGLARKDEFEAARAAFLAHHAHNERANSQLAVWAHGLGLVAADAEEAKSALSLLPAVAAFKERRVELEIGVTFDAALGHVYFLAGDNKAALPHLLTAASSCMGLSSPFIQATALFELGLVREAQGERALACQVYQKLEARFRGVPKSRTGEAAALRIAALGC